MQDVQRADDHLPEDLPNLFWNWLWFRRYILGVPQRCVEGMERCHMIELDRGNPAWVKKRELHDELQDLTPADKRRIEFVEHIDWFRQLVFCNDVIAVCRSTSGELGITVRRPVKYSAFREALPGFLVRDNIRGCCQVARSRIYIVVRGWTTLLRTLWTACACATWRREQCDARETPAALRLGLVERVQVIPLSY